MIESPSREPMSYEPLTGREAIRITGLAAQHNQEHLNSQSSHELAAHLINFAFAIDHIPNLISQLPSFDSNLDEIDASSDKWRIAAGFGLNHDTSSPKFLTYPKLSQNPEAYGLNPQDIHLLRDWIIMFREATRSYDISSSAQKIIEDAIIDTTTGLPSKSGLRLDLIKLVSLKKKQQETGTFSRRKNESSQPPPPTLADSDGMFLLLDFDNLKANWNDIHGHPIGDIAIRALSRASDQRRRPTDKICRYGKGDEILLIFPNVTPDNIATIYADIKSLAQNNQQNDQLLNHLQPPPPDITFSAGASSYTKDDIHKLINSSHDPETFNSTLGELIQPADKALYHSKHSGKNQLTVFSPSKD